MNRPILTAPGSTAPERRGRHDVLTFARFVTLPENRLAVRAAEELALRVGSPCRGDNPLLIHGPAGCGKTHIVSALLNEVARRLPNASRTLLAAATFPLPSENADTDALAAARQSDLTFVEDLQQLPARAVPALVQLIDQRLARQLPLVLTATSGPRSLGTFGSRLVSRLVGGLVVGIAPLAPASRLRLLQDRAERRQLAVHPEILPWLAKHTPGTGRQLEAALTRLDELTRRAPHLPTLAQVCSYFQHEPLAPDIELISRSVAGHFQIETRSLRSRRRNRNVLVPRQVAMYLARQLTALSLEQIGQFFGGRDHSTVLHACRRIEARLADDAALAATICQLQAELG